MDEQTIQKIHEILSPILNFSREHPELPDTSLIPPGMFNMGAIRKLDNLFPRPDPLAEIIQSHSTPPPGYEDCLGPFGEVFFDSWCGEPIAWGFKLTRRIAEDRFNALHQFGKLTCSFGSQVWYLVTFQLDYQTAILKYGPENRAAREAGPQGGFQSVTIGQKKFISRQLKWN